MTSLAHCVKGRTFAFLVAGLASSSAAVAAVEFTPGIHSYTATFDVSFLPVYPDLVAGNLYPSQASVTQITVSGLTGCVKSSCNYVSPNNFPPTSYDQLYAASSYSGIGTGQIPYDPSANPTYIVSGLRLSLNSETGQVNSYSAGVLAYKYTDYQTPNQSYTDLDATANVSMIASSTYVILSDAVAFIAISSQSVGTESYELFHYAQGNLSSGSVNSLVNEFFRITKATITISTSLVPGLPAPAPQPSVTDFAALSNAAYHPGSTIPNGYMLIGHVGNQDGSTTYAEAYFRPGDNGGQGQLVISVKGSTSTDDWLERNRSFLGLDQSGINDGLRQVAGFVTGLLQDSRYADADLSFTGHSLGGAMAELLAYSSNADATAFNAPGTSAIDETILDELSTDFSAVSVHSQTSDITDVRQYGDLVSLIGSQEFNVETVRMSNEALINSSPLACVYSCHNMQNLYDALKGGAAITLGIASPINTAAIIELPANLLVATGTKIFNIFENGSQIHWYDPTFTGDVLELDMDGSEARLAGILLGGIGPSYDIYGFEDETWTLLGSADPFQLFSVQNLDRYRIFGASGLTDDNGNYVVGLMFTNDGTFSGTLGSASNENIPGVPEPATWEMMLIGFLAMGVVMKRKLGIHARHWISRGDLSTASRRASMVSQAPLSLGRSG